jgi:hypothetical protein
MPSRSKDLAVLPLKGLANSLCVVGEATLPALSRQLAANGPYPHV